MWMLFEEFSVSAFSSNHGLYISHDILFLIVIHHCLTRWILAQLVSVNLYTWHDVIRIANNNSLIIFGKKNTCYWHFQLHLPLSHHMREWHNWYHHHTDQDHPPPSKRSRCEQEISRYNQIFNNDHTLNLPFSYLYHCCKSSKHV